MILLLSPAKSLDFNSELNYQESSNCFFEKKAYNLAQILKKLSISDLKNLFSISDNLAKLNHQRYQDFSLKYSKENSRPAILAFNGDVYSNIDSHEFNKDDFAFIQKHVMILSGLYGLLRPLDLIQPYRLEMGTNLSQSKYFNDKNIKNLYDFWRDDIASTLNKINKNIVNLASNEYFSAVDSGLIKKNIINIIFKENKNGILKIIGINSKKARGMMTNFVVKNKINKIEHLKEFSQSNYQFSRELSNDNNWIFTR